MRRAPLLLLLACIAAPAGAASQPACPAAAEDALLPAPLPTAAAAIAAGRLRIAVAGSASVLGLGTSGPAAAWPARLEAVLRDRFPGVAIELVARGARGLTAADTAQLLEAEAGRAPVQLALWQTGTVEAARGLEIDPMIDALEDGIGRLRAAGADVVLIDLQFSRFLRANANVAPYLETLRMVATVHGVPMFPRWETMRGWAEGDRIDLERAPPERRIAVADRLNACLAEGIAGLVVAGVEAARR